MGETDKKSRMIEIVGARTDSGATCRGSALGPDAIRKAGLCAMLESEGFNISDSGDITICGEIACDDRQRRPRSRGELNNLEAVNEINKKLYKTIKDTMQYGRFPLVLGGDHSIAAATVMAAQSIYKKIGLIWVDAHGDFNDAESSPSGNIHGTPLSAVCGLGPDEILPFKEYATGFLRSENVALIGARALDTEEKRRIKNAGINVFSADDIERDGIAAVIREAVKKASHNTEGVYLSFDMDSLDPLYAPGVGTPSGGGLSLREAHFLLRYISENVQLLGAEFVEFNPLLDEGNKTAKITVELIYSLLCAE